MNQMQELHTIGTVAEVLGCSRSVIRKWELRGLISPAIRDKTGRRLYLTEDVETLIQFVLLRETVRNPVTTDIVPTLNTDGAM